MIFDVDTSVEEIREKILKANLSNIDLCILSSRDLSLEEADKYLWAGLNQVQLAFNGVFLTLKIDLIRRFEILFKSELINIETYRWFHPPRRLQITSYQEWQNFLVQEFPIIVKEFT